MNNFRTQQNGNKNYHIFVKDTNDEDELIKQFFGIENFDTSKVKYFPYLCNRTNHM